MKPTVPEQQKLTKTQNSINAIKRELEYKPMRLAKVMMSLGLRTGITDSRSIRIMSFFFWAIVFNFWVSIIEHGASDGNANGMRVL
jgi:hypothetical protein